MTFAGTIFRQIPLQELRLISKDFRQFRGEKYLKVPEKLRDVPIHYYLPAAF